MSSKYDFCLFNIKENSKRVIWEITNKCNYKCSYCIFNSDSSGKGKELETKEIFLVIDKLYKDGVKYLKITGGEPFLRKDMIDILRYADKKNIIFDISTNASLLTQKIIDSLSNLKNLSYVHVSLDGFNKNSQEQIRGIGTFDKTIKGLKLLTKKGIYTRIGTVIYKNNQDFIEDIINFVISLKAKEIILSLMEPVGRMKGNNKMVCTKNNSELEKEIKHYKNKYKDKITINYSFSKQEKTSNFIKCPGAEKFLYINSLGYFSPCTWVSEFFPNFISKEKINTINSSINEEKNIKNYRNLLDILSKLGFYGCPKEFKSITIKLLLINKFINELKENKLDSGRRFGNNGALYSFTTENIKGYYENFNFHNKSCLVIGGSGDHMINAFFRGAKAVNIFDINPLSEYYIELKFLLLKNLSYKDFNNFFGYQTSNSFDYNIYKKYSNKLSILTKYFFDELYKSFDKDGKKIRNSNLFNNSYDNLNKKIGYNYYLESEENYNKCIKIIKKLKYNFFNIDFKSLYTLEKINNYDIIIFGNLSDYLKDNYTQEDYVTQFGSDIEKLITNSNAENIIFGYIYNSGANTFRSDIDNPTYQNKLLNKLNAFDFEFESAINKNLKDKVLFFSQKKSLMEDSKNYNDGSSIYEIFSKAEDYPGKITQELLPIIEGKIVLDLGCGTGKYLKLLGKKVKKIYGVDKSRSQLNIAKNKTEKFNNIELICSDANKIPLKNNSIDIIIGAWFFGTIKSKEKQNKIFNEMKRILKYGGSIFLVENSHVGEFEKIRGKDLLEKNSTILYNNSLINDFKFSEFKKITTLFKFNNKKQAIEIFSNIRGETVGKMIKDKIINHEIIIFKFVQNK